MTVSSLLIKMAMSLYIYGRRLEYWNRDDCFSAMCKLAALLSREIPTFSFYIDWFTQKYKDQTDSKLPESGLCAHIILKTCVLQGRHGEEMQLSFGEFVSR